MPTASDALRETMRQRFGDPIDDDGPYNYLKDRGFTEKAGIIKPPKAEYMLSNEEWDCIQFLCDEWDYGYLPE
jgi:hypothetical protein